MYMHSNRAHFANPNIHCGNACLHFAHYTLIELGSVSV